MDIALIGGHGKIALQLIPLLNAAGHHVDAVIRNPEHQEDVQNAGADAVVADLETMDAEALADLFQGHDLVIWSAGAGGGSPQRTYAVDRDAAIRSIDAASSCGVNRYLMVSYFGARIDHGVPPDNGFFVYAEAKAAADAHLRDSHLGWTILAPSSLTDGKATGRIEIRSAESAVSPDAVSRSDVAAVIAAVVARTDLGGRTIEFNSGPIPVEKALDDFAN